MKNSTGQKENLNEPILILESYVYHTRHPNNDNPGGWDVVLREAYSDFKINDSVYGMELQSFEDYYKLPLEECGLTAVCMILEKRYKKKVRLPQPNHCV